ncbi:ABC-2 type transport system ATP-binding protein [Lachnospiraceae bacterium XBB2008]|nr:ABC-2 type transport system ATP-binding protein [Lachnospiraceae bacterium XBB2008]
MIKIEHLTKKYGNHTAVDDLSLDIEPGRIYGFLGPNGAGKSTTMNIITGYLAATAGTVTIDGHDIFKEPGKAKQHIGYLPEIPPLYPDMTVLEYLEFAAELKGIPRTKRMQEVDEACITSGITDVADRLIKNLSKGYRQRVGIAQAILGAPDVIILDEPTAGLDPAQIIEVRDLIRSLGKEHTVILSSHILSEISEVCNYVFIISKGKLVAADETEELLTHMNGSQEVDLVVRAGQTQTEDIISAFGKADGVENVETSDSFEPGCISVRVHAGKERDIREAVFKAAVNAGLTVLEMTTRSRSLEDVFLELTSADEKDNTDETTEEGGDEE